MVDRMKKKIMLFAAIQVVIHLMVFEERYLLRLLLEPPPPSTVPACTLSQRTQVEPSLCCPEEPKLSQVYAVYVCRGSLSSLLEEWGGDFFWQ